MKIRFLNTNQKDFLIKKEIRNIETYKSIASIVKFRMILIWIRKEVKSSKKNISKIITNDHLSKRIRKLGVELPLFFNNSKNNKQ